MDKNMSFYRVTYKNIVEDYDDWDEAWARWMSFDCDATLEVLYADES